MENSALNGNSHKQKWVSFFVKIIVPTILTIVLFIISIFTIIIPSFEKNILDRKREMIRELVNSAWTIIKKYETDEKRGLLSKYAAQMDRIELIILDLNMPGMGGRRCLEELIEIDPRVKVIVASGGPPDGSIRRTLESGAGSFIGKPFVLQEILNKIREILDSE